MLDNKTYNNTARHNTGNINYASMPQMQLKTLTTTLSHDTSTIFRNIPRSGQSLGILQPDNVPRDKSQIILMTLNFLVTYFTLGQSGPGITPTLNFLVILHSRAIRYTELPCDNFTLGQSAPVP